MEKQIFYTATSKREHEELEAEMKKLLRNYAVVTEGNGNIGVKRGFEDRVRISPLVGRVKEIIPLKGKDFEAIVERVSPEHNFVVLRLGETQYQINFDNSVTG